MDKVKKLCIILFLISCLGGCKSAITGFGFIALFIGGPILLLIVLGSVFSGLFSKDEEAKKELPGALLGLRMIVLLFFALFKGCS